MVLLVSYIQIWKRIWHSHFYLAKYGVFKVLKGAIILMKANRSVKLYIL